jgi:cytochrome c peroxidase
MALSTLSTAGLSSARAGTRLFRSTISHSALLLVVALAACEHDATTEPTRRIGAARADITGTDFPTHEEAEALRALAASHGITALVHPAPVRKELVVLGQALLFDPLLSGNRNMACMTCHLPAFSTGDARNLSIGEGGIGLGPARTIGRGLVIPRNAPPLFNLATLKQLFWDGRVSQDSNGVVHTPAGAQITPAMASVFEFGAISAIGMFPVTNRAEMRGGAPRAFPLPLPLGNELALFADTNFTGIWAAEMKRLGNSPEYRAMFEAAYPGTPFASMTFAHAANAMGGFIVDRLSFNNSPWDQFLGGNDHALASQQFRGANTFMNSKCSGCHNGILFTDGKSRNVALAQFGPGEGNGVGGHDDFGRINVTGVSTDKYAFRTSPLRNVDITGPWGHAGQFATLRGFVDHYSESDIKLEKYDVTQIDPSLQGTLINNKAEVLATRSGALNGLFFTPDQIDDLTAYLKALTDDAARDLHVLTPSRVPSGLQVPGGPLANPGPLPIITAKR